MKSLITDNLQHRLPANTSFLQYVSDEMNKHLLALCSTLFPNSAAKAYIISGVKSEFFYYGTDGYARYTKGVIYYNNEFLECPEHWIWLPNGSLWEGYSPGLTIQSEIINEEYADGNTLPAYEVRKLIWAPEPDVTGPLALYNMAIVGKYPGV